MSKTSDDPEKVRWWPFWLILSFVVIFWFASVIEWFPWWATKNEGGEFGDSFGAINALFAGLAFTGVIFAIILQWQELRLQRQELRDTRTEIRGQKETLQKQNFESSFFQLLNMHSEIVSSIVILETNMRRSLAQGDIEYTEYSGRRCFGYLLRNLKSSLEKAIDENRPKTEVFNDTYEEEFFSIYQTYIGHYFRHLYNVVKFVHEHEFFDQKEFKEKKRYTNFIRAQLSSNELGVLFYNCLSDRGAQFKDLVEKYALFEDLPSKVLIDEEHRKLYAPSAYGESG